LISGYGFWMTTPAAYAIAIEHCVDGAWCPFTEPYTQAFDLTPDEIAEAVAENWNLAELDRPWVVAVFKGIRFDEKLAELKG
jgi:hypothetical protein